MDFMDLKLSLWLIRKTLKKCTKTKKSNTHFDGRFDKTFYRGFHKSQITLSNNQKQNKTKRVLDLLST